MKLVNLSNGKVIASNVNEANTFFKRLKGLMFTKMLHRDAGLHIKPCQSVHTFFMNYCLDILYIDKSDTIVAIDEAMAPGKVGRHYRKAASVIELPAGKVKETETKVGQSLKFI
ncbi:uncharacterized membrane protein (UPF0127 family) [Evansella vedderi]|uniref:Uncharacterized membrane protein (UPF0127 family) n=1 Tax=Evansella vedderi TaxID=38282 RepID=A0ABU0A3Q9_9BACI|nr:DUF192 domain-containing protein [Evansella vedderi]MDQ0256990.1 uncharacterized membrane protein (UPF0127 family) [Evansella vedderi]